MTAVCHTRGLIVAWLLFSSVVAVGQSQRPAVTDEPAQLSATGAITGKVVDENGQPLPNATVTIRAYGVASPGRVTTTDREGKFQAGGLDRVAYLLSAQAPAYTTLPRDPDAQSNYYRVGDTVTLVLVKGGVITGNITTGATEPVVGVRVRVQMLRDVAGQPPRYGAIFRERFTDDRGIYRIYGLPPGTYLVMAGGGGNYGYGANAYDYDSPTYSPSSSRDTAAEVNVNAGEETANVDIRYRAEPGYVVSGIASGPSAPENSGFNVNLTATLDGGSQWNDSSYQPQGGRGFAFYGVADGDYDITAQTYLSGEWALSESRRIKVRGADISQIELITKPMGAISGRVALEDSKAAECKNKRRPLFSETLITVWHNEKIKAKDQPQFIWSLGAPASPDKQGNISLRSLAPGQYHFITRFSAKYWYLKSISLKAPSSGAKPLTPAADIDAARNWTTIKTGERLSGLTVTLAEGAASLQGKLVFQDSDKPPPRLFVYLVPAEPEKANDVLRFFATPVEQDGKITVNNLAPGRYWIVVRPPLVVGSSTLTKLRLPDETETRAKLRQDAEASNTTIEFKPCQNVLDYKLGFKPSTTAAAKQ